MIGKLLCTGAMLLLLCVQSEANEAADWIRDSLKQKAHEVEACSQEDRAIQGTLSRMNGLELPETGKVIIVNIASGVVTAYEDGVPVIESKGIVGKDTTPTPEMKTHVTFVRPNPTWTVPRSIIKRNHWLDKLRDEPEFFENNNFSIISDGVEISPYDAAQNPESVQSFVQNPGENNALGTIKIGIENSQSIYLHDTNDRGKFDEEVRSASAGCVRIERITDIAAWTLGISGEEMDSIVETGSTESITPPEEVKVILGYWTAWPDANGQINFFPDIYSKDGSCSNLSEEPETFSEERPRYIPDESN